MRQRKVAAEDFKAGRRCGCCGQKKPEDKVDLEVKSTVENAQHDFVVCISCYNKMFFGKEEAEIA